MKNIHFQIPHSSSYRKQYYVDIKTTCKSIALEICGLLYNGIRIDVEPDHQTIPPYMPV